MAFEWKKLGLIFDPLDFADRPEWMAAFAQAPNAVLFDDFVRVYFCCRPAPDERQQFVSYCAYVDLSKDGKFRVINVATDPIMSLGELGTFDEFGTYPVSVIRDGKELLAIYGGWTRCESVPFNISLGSARSLDGGVTFKKMGPGPMLSHSPDEPFVVTSPKIRKFGDVWCLAYTAGMRWICDAEGKPEIIYKLRMATSVDGINWTKLNKNLVDDVLGEDEAQASPDIVFADGRYHMFFCFRRGLDFRTSLQASYRIGYASSTNLIDWVRHDQMMDLPPSDSGWDSEMIAYPNVFELDGKFYMLYAGNGNGKTGFGIAVLQGGFAR
nr:hypothetical protein [uncultured Undibacterium sp.]